MSKTDKTAPFWVKEMRGDLATEEVHYHIDGPCDLPDRRTEAAWVWPRVTRCYHTFVYTGVHVCCCKHCHGDYCWDIPPGRRQRRTSKELCRNWEREYFD